MINNLLNEIKKMNVTQRFAFVALFFLGSIIVSQLLEKQQFAEKFAILLYYILCISTLSALTEPYHAKVLRYFTLGINKLNTFNTQKHYRWTYVSYFLFVFLLIMKYGFTDRVMLLTVTMSRFLIYFPGWCFFILSILYTIAIPALTTGNSVDIQYGIVYFILGILTTVLAPKFFK